MTKVGDILIDGYVVGEIRLAVREEGQPPLAQPDFGSDLIPNPHEDNGGGGNQPQIGHGPPVSPGTSRRPLPGGGPTFRPGIGPGSRRRSRVTRTNEDEDATPREEGDLTPAGRAGGRFNVRAGGARLRPGERETIVLSNGERVTVNKQAAAQFRGFFEDLIEAGAPVHTLGGLGARLGNASQHPVGLAVDWAQLRRDTVSPDVARWMHNNQDTLNTLESKWGMSGGEHWRTPDRGHFSIDTLYGSEHLARLKGRGATPAGREIEGPRDAEVPGARAPTPGPRPRTEAAPPLRTDEPPAVPRTPGALPPTNGSLYTQRTRFADELKDEKTHERLFRLTQAENPQNPQAFMESVMNRAAARNQTLTEAMNDVHYYPRVSQIGREPRDRASMQAAMSRVLGGSNMIGYATGNASLNVGFGYGRGARDPYTYRDPATNERYGVENRRSDIDWATRQHTQELLANQARARAARTVLPSQARVDIGAPQVTTRTPPIPPHGTIGGFTPSQVGPGTSNPADDVNRALEAIKNNN